MTLQEVSPRSILAISLDLALPLRMCMPVCRIWCRNPSSWSPAPGVFELTAQTVLTAAPGAEREAQQLASWLRASSGYELRSRERGGNRWHRAGTGPLIGNIARQGRLSTSVTPTRITIRSATEAGLFYGGITLQQLLPVEAFGALPAGQAPRLWTVACVEVEDSPRFVWRGLLLDVARHFMPVESIKVLRLAALHKFNMLQLHLTDDQGWRIEIQPYPLLTEIGSVRTESPGGVTGPKAMGRPTALSSTLSYSAGTRRLCAGAACDTGPRDRNARPPPRRPGRLSAIFLHRGALSGTYPMGHRTRRVVAGNDEAIEFALNVLAEVTDLFPSRFIHIGGDEAPRDRWKTYPNTKPGCAPEVRDRGTTSDVSEPSRRAVPGDSRPATDWLG